MKKILAIIFAVLVIAGAAIGIYIHFTAEPPLEEGEKRITVHVTVDGETETFCARTYAVTLRGVLDEMDLVKGIEAEYGLYVQQVNGVTADPDLQQWWKFSLNGEMLQTGIEAAPFSDGDVLDIERMQGYDTF